MGWRITLRLVALHTAACASVPAPHAIDQQQGRSPAPRTIARRASPPLALSELAVSDDDFYRRVLYTWTTPASIAKLRASHRLLVATAATGGFVSPFNRALAQVAAGTSKGASIAQLLTTHPALLRRRYAWPAPFATVLGMGRRTYGNALVRIELRPEAWIGRFDPSAAMPFSFVDARGAAVPTSDVLAQPERVGAIFHVRTEATLAVRFREYVVCSEAMIASWSVATPQIRTELDREIGLLLELRSSFAPLARVEATRPASPVWAHAPTTTDPAVRWRAALAFDNARYRPTLRSLDAILAALRIYDAAGAPLVVVP